MKWTDTHVCGWVGSSPRETVSPWISLKHFSQKWYLSARSPNFGELHRSPKQSVIDSAREGSHQLVQDMGRVGCHKRSKQEVEAQHSRKSSSQQPVMILRGGGEGMCLEVHGWSRQKQANVDITTIGREDGQVIWTGNKTRQTSKTTHSREPRQSTY